MSTPLRKKSEPVNTSRQRVTTAVKTDGTGSATRSRRGWQWVFPGASRPVWLGGSAAGLWEKPEHRGEPRPRPGASVTLLLVWSVARASCLVPVPSLFCLRSLLLAFLHLPPLAPPSPASPHLFLLLSSPDFLPLHSNFAKHFLLLKLNLVRNKWLFLKAGRRAESLSPRRGTLRPHVAPAGPRHC